MGSASQPDLHGRRHRCRRLRAGPGTRLVNEAGTRVAAWPMGDLAVPSRTARWRFAVVSVASTGRISLPAAARAALGVGASATVRSLARGDSLLVRRDGIGRRLAVDGRGRLTLPVWLRHAGAVLVATRVDRPLVLVAPVSVLEAMADHAAGEW